MTCCLSSDRRFPLLLWGITLGRRCYPEGLLKLLGKRNSLLPAAVKLRGCRIGQACRCFCQQVPNQLLKEAAHDEPEPKGEETAVKTLREAIGIIYVSSTSTQWTLESDESKSPSSFFGFISEGSIT